MSKYLFTLKPIDNFFFGGEISFRPGVSKNDKKQSYITKSNIFPQQTTILGMLRKEILIKEKEYSEEWNYKNKQKLTEFIGKNSFNLSSSIVQEYGMIKSISPLFILRDNIPYITAPLNHKKSEKIYKPFDLNIEVETSLGKIKIPQSDFKSKDGLFYGFMNGATGEIVAEDQIFIEDSRVGIEKDSNGGAKDERFYKIISYRMNKEYCFAFNAEIDDVDFNGYRNIVFIGSEGLGFVLTANKVEEELIDKIKLPGNIDFLVLLSDTYATKEMYESCSYSISESVDFRSIVTTYDSSTKIHNHKIRYSLLRRGSVLYSDNMNQLRNLLESQRNLSKVGYNRFK